MLKYIPRRKRLRNSYITSGDLKLLVMLVDKYGSWKTKGQNLRKQLDDYLYANIEEDSFYYTFKTNQTFKEVKEIISKKTKLHPNMMSFGKWSRFDEKENMNYYTEVNYNDNEVLYKSCFDQPYIETKYLYVIIDKKRMTIIKYIMIYMQIQAKKQKRQIKNIKIQKMKRKIQKLNQKK